MSDTLFILNEAPYGSERTYNALRLAGALAGESHALRVFLMGDAVLCAKNGQRVPEGYYNTQLMLAKISRHGEIGVCGTCLDARGIEDHELAPGTIRSTLTKLAEWTTSAEKVLVF